MYERVYDNNKSEKGHMSGSMRSINSSQGLIILSPFFTIYMKFGNLLGFSEHDAFKSIFNGFQSFGNSKRVSIVTNLDASVGFSRILLFLITACWLSRPGHLSRLRLENFTWPNPSSEYIPHGQGQNKVVGLAGKSC